MLVISQFVEAYSHSLDGDVFRRLLAPALNSAKSANPLARIGSVELFKAIIKKPVADSDLSFSVNELLSLPKAGKTAGPDHRVALYSMLSEIGPSLSVSPSIASIVPQLVAKETHDAASSLLATALPHHLTFLLSHETPIPSEVAQLLAKGMSDSKPAIRRSFCLLVGSVLWELGDLTSTASLTFTNALLPALENNIKNVVANPLNAVAGPLEGYIAIAVLLGPLSRSGKFGAFDWEIPRRLLIFFLL